MIRHNFQPERIEKMQAFINQQKQKGLICKNQVSHIGNQLFRDSLRLRGFEQSLDTQLHALLQKQILQEEIGTRDNTGLNGIYHGDVYASRIPKKSLNDKPIIDTLGKSC